MTAVMARGKASPKLELFTIGYERRDIELYVGELVANGIALLCDVRKNPMSRRKGFSKNKLREAVEAAGIEYRHFPQLGVPREERQAAKTPAARRRMFARYGREVLAREREAVEELAALLERYRCIALTCVERDHTDCHRSLVAEAVLKMISASSAANNL